MLVRAGRRGGALTFAANPVSTPEKIRRPLWRSFTHRFIANAVRHVREGGHALVWRPGTAKKPVAWMLLPCGPEGELPELA